MLAFLRPLMTVRLAAWFIALVVSVDAQNIPSGPASSPQDYPDKPSGDFSPAWQQCKSSRAYQAGSSSSSAIDFQVTASLPNVTFPLPRQWAGNIPVQRPDHPNNTLFFWGFEKENGSLTAAAGERTSEPWGIWLNGGHVVPFIPVVLLILFPEDLGHRAF
jgi:carboxypeptidase D